ncbi:MAG: hypothetical protein RL026_1158 [Pseudomonadota bacterium]
MDIFKVEGIVSVGLVEAFNAFIIVYFMLVHAGLLGLFLFSWRALADFLRNLFATDYAQIRASDLTLPISMLVPAYNEERGIVESVRSLLRANYGEFEVVVINDGSADGTLQVLMEEFGLQLRNEPVNVRLKSRKVRGLYRSTLYPNLVVMDKERGGKSDALNAGLNVSRYPLFCSIDADSVIERDALLRIVKPFIEHPGETVAVGGIVRVGNGCLVRDGQLVEARLPRSRLAVMQVVEYLRAFLAGRAGWSTVRSLLIISGAFGLYRKSDILEIGGYSDNTDTEDAEIVVRLHKHMCEKGHPYRVVFVPDPVCWTEVPESLRVLVSQRSRWHRGLLQTLWIYRGMLFRRRYGNIGMFGMPWYLVFELLAPVVEVLGYIFIPLARVVGILNTEAMLGYLLLSFLLGTLLSVSSILLEEVAFCRYGRWRDLLRLMLYGVVENFGFRQFLTLVKVKALLDAFLKRRQWGDMKRQGLGGPAKPRVDGGSTAQKRPLAAGEATEGTKA